MNDKERFDKEYYCMPELTGLREIGICKESATGRQILKVLANIPQHTIEEFPSLYLGAVKSLILYGLDKKTKYVIYESAVIWEDDLRRIMAL